MTYVNEFLHINLARNYTTNIVTNLNDQLSKIRGPKGLNSHRSTIQSCLELTKWLLKNYDITCIVSLIFGLTPFSNHRQNLIIHNWKFSLFDMVVHGSCPLRFCISTCYHTTCFSHHYIKLFQQFIQLGFLF